jgi:hypothetical protein
LLGQLGPRAKGRLANANANAKPIIAIAKENVAAAATDARWGLEPLGAGACTITPIAYDSDMCH